MDTRETTIKRLAAFNLQLGRDYNENELERAVIVHGIYAAKAIIHARTIASMAKWESSR